MKIRGTRNDDTLTGGAGPDVIRGLRGNDALTGGGGNDVLYGGDGDDRLDGGAGSDRLLGGDGDDTIESSGSATIDGGAGADTITLQRHADDVIVDAGDGDDRVILQDYLSLHNSISLGTGEDTFDANQCTFDVSGGDGADTFSTLNARGATIAGGAGDDVVRANNTEESGLTIDAGDGDDFVSINTTSYDGAHHTVTLGDGRDTLELRADGFTFDANVTVTDFETGRGGDSLRLSNYLFATCDNYDGGDPFAEGFLRLQQSKAGALLQIDNNGGGDEWRTIVVFENARAAAFRPANFDDGYDPRLSSAPLHQHADFAPATDGVTP